MSKQDQAYIKAIELIGNTVIDYKQVALMLAQRNPHLFCELCSEPEFRLESEVVHLLEQNNGIVSAVKHYRNETGLGLKESKEAVERIRDRM